MTRDILKFGRAGLVALAGVLSMTVVPAFAQATSPSGSQGSYQTPATGTSSSQMNASGMTTRSAAMGQPLTTVKNPKTTLASAQVQDSSGQQVGRVSKVLTSSTGHASKIDITLTSSAGGQPKTISVRASKLKYDKTSNKLITDMTASELQAMPAATSSSM